MTTFTAREFLRILKEIAKDMEEGLLLEGLEKNGLNHKIGEGDFLDSLDVTEILIELEERLNIDIDDNVMDQEDLRAAYIFICKEMEVVPVMDVDPITGT